MGRAVANTATPISVDRAKLILKLKKRAAECEIKLTKAFESWLEDQRKQAARELEHAKQRVAKLKTLKKLEDAFTKDPDERYWYHDYSIEDLRSKKRGIERAIETLELCDDDKILLSASDDLYRFL